jgi:hypothetical protein
MKYILFAVVGVSLVWELSFSGWNLLVVANPFDLSCVMWGVATVYLCDFTAAMAGRNSPYMTEFYHSLKKDFAVSALWGATLFAVLCQIPARYSFASLDIASFGMPLLVYSLFATVESGKIEIFRQSLPKRIVCLLIFAMFAAYLYFAHLLIEIGRNDYPASKALWYQITILATSLAVFVGSYFIRFALLKRRLEPSPILLRFFDGVPGAVGIYRLASEASHAWNQHVAELEIEARTAVILRRRKRLKSKRR